MSLRIAFMGTPEFAVPSLSEILASGHDVVRVYTQAPQRAGRGKHMRKSPVHQFAEIMGIPVETPASFRKPSVINELEALDVDAACVVAYGQILPQRALDAPRHGCLNLHGSLLPRWRGAAPVQRAIMAGDTKTAAQIMQMEKGLDTGAVLLSEIVSITQDDTAGSLHDKLSQVGASLWPRALAALARGGLVATPQAGEPSYAHKIDKKEARINWSKPASTLECLIRGLSPFPGAWCELPARKDAQRVKIHLARVEEKSGKSGLVLDDELLIGCGDKSLRLLKLQPAGKGVMSADDYLRGRPCAIGTQLS